VYYTVVTNYLQSVSVTTGIGTITALCRVANSRTKSYCSAYFSPGTPDAYVYTFQGIEEFTASYAPGQHNVSVKVFATINDNLVVVEESDFVVIVPVVSSSIISAVSSVTTSTLLKSITLSPSSSTTSSPSHYTLAMTPSTSTQLQTLVTSSSLFLSTSSGLQATSTAAAGTGRYSLYLLTFYT